VCLYSNILNAFHIVEYGKSKFYLTFLFLKKNRIEYYEHLNEVRNKGDYKQWIKFFLRAISESAKDAYEKIKQISGLIEKDRNLITSNKLGTTAMKVYEYLLINPIVEIQKTADGMAMSFNTVATAISKLSDWGILQQTAGKQRYRIFTYEAYLEILKEGT